MEKKELVKISEKIFELCEPMTPGEAFAILECIKFGIHEKTMKKMPKS